MNNLFHGYLPDKNEWKERERGSLVARETGITRLYGLTNVQDRGDLFDGPGISVYKGQVNRPKLQTGRYMGKWYARKKSLQVCAPRGRQR
ncbi:MAG: hypothetical protein U5N58_13180 [Actinomycetota bacterium]|nr:hypothetical protein [Actinomycetota bacterium]